MDRETRKSLAKLGGVWTLGLSMPLSIALGLGVGVLFDRWLGTGPVLTMVFLLLGIVAAFVTLVRETSRLE
jgi:F0F1-type ATP synthase assembly protein I